MAVRNFRDEPFSTKTTSMPARHVGLGPCFVDENETGRIELALMALPPVTPLCDVRPVLFAGVQAFF